MNLSGHAVTSFLSYFIRDFKDDLSERLLIVYDDLDLPEGRLRFRSSGASGGHKGLQSVLNQLGHDRFSRLKIGVGRNLNSNVKDFVLEKVSGDSIEALGRAVDLSAEALLVWLREGVGPCMNRFNKSED